MQQHLQLKVNSFELKHHTALVFQRGFFMPHFWSRFGVWARAPVYSATIGTSAHGLSLLKQRNQRHDMPLGYHTNEWQHDDRMPSHGVLKNVESD